MFEIDMWYGNSIDYYETTVDKEDENDTWIEFWEANLDALKDDNAIVVIDGVKYVKD